MEQSVRWAVSAVLGSLSARMLACGGLLAIVLVGQVGCSSSGSEPPTPRSGPPYLAVVAKVDAADGVSAGVSYTYRIRERSGTLGVDTVISAAPTDTVIVSVPNETAQYDVTLEGVPEKCRSRYGMADAITIPANSNTAIIRFYIICKPLVEIIGLREGVNLDRELLFRLDGPGRSEVGTLSWPATSPDTSAYVVRLVEDAVPGEYTLSVADIAPNCTIVSQGLRRVRFTVRAEGGTTVAIRMTCTDEARRPRFLAAAARYQDEHVGITFTAVDPDRNLDWYYWDVTDCRGYSVLKYGQISRRGIYGARGARDTVRVAALFDVSADSVNLSGRCVALRTWDSQGNTTPVQEVLLAPNGIGPTAFDFNAVIREDQSALDLTVQLTQPVFAIYPTVRVRDGILGTRDGLDDIGIYSVAGFVSPVGLPSVPLGGRIQWFDVLASEVYLFDAEGNFRELRDTQLAF